MFLELLRIGLNAEVRFFREVKAGVGDCTLPAVLRQHRNSDTQDSLLKSILETLTFLMRPPNLLKDHINVL